jgi:hypothetical protein
LFWESLSNGMTEFINKPRKKILSIVALIVMGTILLSTAIVSNTLVNTNEIKPSERPIGTYSKSLPTRSPLPMTLTDSYGELAVSIDQAKRLSSMEVKTLSKLPKGTELQSVYIKKDAQNDTYLVTQVYTPREMQVTAYTTFADVMDNNGIIVLYSKEATNFDRQSWLEQYSKNPNVDVVVINGMNAIAIDGTPENGERSQIMFYDQDVFVNLVSVGYHRADLIEMAKSLQ